MSFLTQDKQPDWDRLTELLEKCDYEGGLRSLSPEELRELSRLYRVASSDLSLARARRREDLVQYLNQLVGRAHNRLYARRAGRKLQLLEFFGATVPATFRECLPYWLFALGVLIAGGTIGYVATAQNTDWATIIGGAGLKEAMGTFLQSNKPAGEYFADTARSMGHGGFSGFLMTNNIQVALLCFALGIGWGVGTLFVLARNALHLGAALGLGAHHGKLLVMLSIVAPHGVVEISAVVIAAAAGLRLGYALINPGDYLRRDALMVAARQAGQLALGTIPMFIFAGLVEGLLSPLSTGPFHSDQIRLAFGALSGIALYLWLFHGWSPVKSPENG
ncbi:MAG: stage II sporulation protein M [Armatimonadia bacterium]